MKKQIIGITGGISSGKSNVASEIRKFGYPVFDADLISKESLDYNTPCYLMVCEIFGEKILNSDFTINRQKLATIIFNDVSKRQELMKIIHPYVKKELEENILKSTSDLVFIDVPLLFETDFHLMCDKIICVYLDKNLQLERLITRDNIDKSLAIKKIESQLPLDIKVKKSDYVINSSGTLSETKKQIEKLMGVLTNGKTNGNK